MIGTIDISINAANPQLPLSTLYAFQSSPSSVRLLNVPKAIGKWSITGVTVSWLYPSNVTSSATCVKSGGVWVGTIAASSAVGKSAKGFQVTASGTDENGATITGYVLGVGDLEILPRDGTVTAGTTKWAIRFCETVPATPVEGDAAYFSGVLKWYHGGAWVAFGGGGGDMSHSEFATLDEEESSLSDVIRLLKGSAVAALAVCAITAFGYQLDIQTAKLGTLPAKTMVVTNATFDATGIADNYIAVSNAAMRAFPSQGDMGTGSIVWDGGGIKITTENGTTVNGFLTASNLTVDSDCHLTGMTYFYDDTSFKIGDEYFGDWIKSGVWNTAEDPFAKRSEIPSPYTDAMASNVVTNVVTKSYVENLGISSAGYENYVWSYPNCWYINVTMSNRVDVSVIPSETVVGYMVFSNDVEATTSGTDARCRAVLCDESSIETPSIKEWKSFTAGGSITSNGVFSADADGLYRVSAEDAVGKIRYVDIPIQSDVTTYATNTYYATDVAGTVRASVNGAALTILQNATVVSTNYYEGTEYTVYSSFTPRMSAVGTGAGNVKCWAVSQHILSSAKHYAVKQLGANTFSDGVNSATVYRQEWVSLSDWAATNGFTAAEIAEAGIDDICLIRCSKSSAVPDGCIPYFMRSDKIDTWFGGTLAGVQAWMSVQDHTEAIPTTYKWEGDYTLNDVKAQYCRMGTLYPVHSGDSGRCIFIMKDGNPIMLRQFGTAYEGPSFVNGFKIIKAFVENYGDTLKEAN